MRPNLIELWLWAGSVLGIQEIAPVDYHEEPYEDVGFGD